MLFERRRRGHLRYTTILCATCTLLRCCIFDFPAKSSNEMPFDDLSFFVLRPTRRDPPGVLCLSTNIVCLPVSTYKHSMFVVFGFRPARPAATHPPDKQTNKQSTLRRLLTRLPNAPRDEISRSGDPPYSDMAL